MRLFDSYFTVLLFTLFHIVIDNKCSKFHLNIGRKRILIQQLYLPLVVYYLNVIILQLFHVLLFTLFHVIDDNCGKLHLDQT